MQRSRPNSHPRRSAAFTLFEMMISMSVIVLIAGIVWPILMQFFDESELLDSGRVVRDTLSTSRLAAIDMGVPYHFVYEPGGSHFLMIPAGGVEQAQEEGIQGSETFPTRAGELSEGYTFQPSEGDDAGTMQVDAGMMGAVPDASGFDGAAWSSPAVFFPDGTGIDYRFEIRDEAGRYVTLSVRGLTGESKVSPLRYGGGTSR
jgi:type II secretory pathway pseudopilin PulG